MSAAIDIATHPDAKRRPARLTLLHRRDQFQAEAALEAPLRALIASGQVELAVGLPHAATIDQGHIKALTLLGADGQTRELPLDHLLIRQGMSPKLGPVAQWGLALDRKQVAVAPASFRKQRCPACTPWATSIPTPARSASCCAASMRPRWPRIMRQRT
ncbi:MAG: hypothetical protein QM749_07680 [Aquabacterium sp.]